MLGKTFLIALPLLTLLLSIPPPVYAYGDQEAPPPQSEPDTTTPKPKSEPPHPPDTHPTDTQPPPSKAQMQAGKKFFVRGQELFKEGKYEAAWIEFSSAHEIAALPELIFNMARCEVKMGRLKEALAHYREFLEARPDDPEGDRIRDEIARLDRQLNGVPEPSSPPPSPPPPPPKRRFPIAGTLLGGGAALFLIFGGISLGVGLSRYNDLADSCKPHCTDSQVQTVSTPLNAGYALFGLAAVAAVAAAVVLPFELGAFHKEKDKERQAALAVGPGSLTVVGRF